LFRDFLADALDGVFGDGVVQAEMFRNAVLQLLFDGVVLRGGEGLIEIDTCAVLPVEFVPVLLQLPEREGVGDEVKLANGFDEESDLKSRREDVNDEIEELRTKIERIEQQAIEEFNDHMDTVLETLSYENIARIWLERTEKQVRKSRPKVTKSVFELYIIRQTESGTTYEDSIMNLSEREREVTGLIFALAGYLAHEVYETVPFMLLDSPEDIGSDRISRLVDYFSGYSDFLGVALLTEDAQALPDSHDRITEI
jgi:hypothetical protein